MIGIWAIRQSDWSLRFIIRSLDVYMPPLKLLPEGVARDVAASIAIGTVTWVSGTILTRLALKVCCTLSMMVSLCFNALLLQLLLKYKGFLYEGPGQSNLQFVLTNCMRSGQRFITYHWHCCRTKLWVVVMKALTFWSTPLTYSYQSFLPSLPGLIHQ